MRIQMIGILTASLLLAACASSGGGPESRAPVYPKFVVNESYRNKPAEADDMLICTFEEKTGSHIRVRYCATAEERERQRIANEKAAQDGLAVPRPVKTAPPAATVFGRGGS